MLKSSGINLYLSPTSCYPSLSQSEKYLRWPKNLKRKPLSVEKRGKKQAPWFLLLIRLTRRKNIQSKWSTSITDSESEFQTQFSNLRQRRTMRNDIFIQTANECSFQLQIWLVEKSRFPTVRLCASTIEIADLDSTFQFSPPNLWGGAIWIFHCVTYGRHP